MSVQGQIAAIRFGLGLRLGESPPAEPRAWLLEQLEKPAPGPEGAPIADAMAIRIAFQQARRPRDPVGDRAATQAALIDFMQAEIRAQTERRLTTGQPFRERLVDFWMNHFTVSRRDGNVSLLIGDFERRAIRPHLTGPFEAMVLAVARHPAMLFYLNNTASVGPDSPAGQRIRRGLNENLAREILELHTLSPAGGYTQGDVQELARILTGWSVNNARPPHDFQFRPAAHEPGPKRLLGQRFAEGEAGGEAALRVLARHPATARHLAVKLARHFVADTPPPAAVSALERVLRESDCDLGAASRALVQLPEAWDPPLTKFRTPSDYTLAAGRALGLTGTQGDLVRNGMGQLAQPLWTAPQPNGWPDRAAEWATPEALMRRVDWAYRLAGRFARADLAAVTEAALGPFARAETVAEMRRAGSTRDALTLLLASPEFMHR
ncbi:DUF1800 domain-containing protein [Falsiroseomonas selenitidurans]|uniref:DUF1800 domain-containing protein n=1 Tax=Falsiroseomonas selenitidurans TaxID=2716335 RepID=A0ABX1E0R2_9PROT|nr:DUF1800 domain-containing protein [Falsiroseomonas selenitidurans]NKC30744.1 DUF1800 domain-containing protein [Falsiroseomonas selenitidurans]